MSTTAGTTPFRFFDTFWESPYKSKRSGLEYTMNIQDPGFGLLCFKNHRSIFRDLKITYPEKFEPFSGVIQIPPHDDI